jgi:hypothetical protein
MSLRSALRVPGHSTLRAAILYAALTAAVAYPLSVRPGSTVVANVPDTHLFIWTLAWNARAFVTNPLSIFDANIYHPERLTLAYSENIIGSALFSTPVYWLTGNPVLAMNTVALLSCFLCGLGAYVLGRRVGLGEPAALLCGIVFAFSPPRFYRISQLHLTTVQWIPFSLAYLHKYADEGRRRDLRLAIGFAVLQTLTSGHGGVFLGFAVALFVLWRLALGTPVNLRQRLRDVGIPGLLMLLPVVAIAIPYRIVQNEMGLRRTLENWAVTPESFLASPSRVHAAVLSELAPQVNELALAYLFPGYLPLALAVAGIWWIRQPAGPAASRGLRWLAAGLNMATLASLFVAVRVMTAGPVRIHMGSIPVFVARTPGRAWIVCALCVAARLAVARAVAVAPLVWARAVRNALARRPYPNAVTGFYLLLTIASLLMAVGPPISLWPVVYWLPGFNFIRGPSRFTILTVLGLGVLAGLGYERLFATRGARARSIGAILIGTAMLVELAPLPLGVVAYDLSIPPADQWLALQPKPFVVAEVPVGGERLQTAFMLHSMAHWQKTVSGYSGIRPALHDELYAKMRTFPDEESVRRLQELGVTYVVVHSDLYPAGQWPAVEDRLRSFEPRLRLQHSARGGYVYALSAPSEVSGRPLMTTESAVSASSSR